MLKSTRSTFPSPFRSTDAGGLRAGTNKQPQKNPRGSRGRRRSRLLWVLFLAIRWEHFCPNNEPNCFAERGYLAIQSRFGLCLMLSHFKHRGIEIQEICACRICNLFHKKLFLRINAHGYFRRWSTLSENSDIVSASYFTFICRDRRRDKNPPILVVTPEIIKIGNVNSDERRPAESSPYTENW